MKAYKTELDSNNVQRTLLLKSAGTARFAYNWGLAKMQEQFEQTGKSSTCLALRRELNGIKRTEFPWMLEVSKCCPQEALRDLEVAYQRFFKGVSGHPTFKSKKNGAGSFTFSYTKVSSDRIQIPRIGDVRLKERNYLPIDQHILSATVSEKAGRWFVSVLVREEIKVPENNGPVVGVDLNIAPLAVVSDKTEFANPKALRRNERKLKRLQMSLSRKRKGSSNRNKARQRVAKIHNRIADIRGDAQHKATTMLTKTKSVIGVEDLAVKNLVRNHKLAKAISDASFGEFRRQLEYKAKWYGSRIVVADRWFPSTKKCCECGKINEIPLGQEIYTCDCGNTMSRHLNAARNLEAVALSFRETLNACGELAATEATVMQADSVNQEPNAIREMS
ncbi:MAG: RNA-guided endonuclease TnpB family protein [Candidatus Bathyarchaeia archaeon]|jgi:putative transposase